MSRVVVRMVSTSSAARVLLSKHSVFGPVDGASGDGSGDGSDMDDDGVRIQDQDIGDDGPSCVYVVLGVLAIVSDVEGGGWWWTLMMDAGDGG